MNKQFTDEQIKAYASNFREGDAIWSGGKWCEVVEHGMFDKLATKGIVSKNEYILNGGEDNDFDGVADGFSEDLADDPFCVTTLEHYELQGGEKVIGLDEDDDIIYGKTYRVFMDDGVPFVDSGNTMVGTPVGGNAWGVIPRYEQVKNLGKTTITEQVNEVVASKMNKEKEDDEVSEIKVVEESKYTGKFEVGDEVRIIGLLNDADSQVKRRINEVGVIARVVSVMPRFNYIVRFNDTERSFNEAELELVTSKFNDDKEKGNVSDEEFDELLNTIDDVLKPVELTTDRVNELKLKTYEVVMGKSSHNEIIDELKDIAHIDINNGRYDDAIKAIELIKEWQQHDE